MKYSNAILTDDNFDEEFEKLTAMIGNLNSDEYDVYDALPSGFTEQESEDTNGNKRGFSEWIKSGGIKPDVSHGHNQVLCSGELAYEFGNKFIEDLARTPIQNL